MELALPPERNPLSPLAITASRTWVPRIWGVNPPVPEIGVLYLPPEPVVTVH